MIKYITPEAVIEQVDADWNPMEGDYPFEISIRQLKESLRVIAPAAVAPVRHGRWIFEEFDGVGCAVKCSLCGYGNDCCDRNVWLRFPGHHYCGSCGAKMNEEG